MRRPLGFGLLWAVRREARTGRAVTHDQISARSFFVPFEVTGRPTLEAFLRAGLEGLFHLGLKAEARLMRAHRPHGE